MKKNIFFYFLLAIQISITTAQEQASAQWTCAQPDSQQVSAIAGAVEAFAESGGRNFNVYSYNSGVLGPLGLAAQRWCPFDGETRFSWGDQFAPVDTQFIQFSIKAKTGFTMHADSVSMYLGAGGTTDHINTRVLYSLSEDFSSAIMISDSASLPPRDVLGKYSYEINADMAAEDTLFIRVYSWYDGSPSTSKYLYVQDVNIYGTTQAEINPASATWELTDPGTGGTGQTVSTSGPIDATEEAFSNMRINQYTGAEESQRSDNRPPGGASQWPESQTERIDSVYIQFTVSAKEGTKLNVNNIAFRIGGNSTNYLKAEVLYSLDSAFTTFSKIPDSLVLEGAEYAYPGHLLRADTLRAVSFDLDTLVDSGETLFLRFYPWVNDQTTGLTGKYLLLKNVVISGGVEGTVTYDLPTVTTKEISTISTNFAYSGGNISTDGGSPVIVRGVVYNTSGSPTIADSKTENGEGSGSFTSFIDGLTAGENYFLRAYATNIAGTGYGEEKEFSTLDSLEVPAVITAKTSDILAVKALAGGEVTAWGGDSVLVRGVCWNSTGNPSLADNVNEKGSGLGSFSSILYPLSDNTKYYVRAFATNSKGTGYGAIDSFTTQEVAADVEVTVAGDGSGDYMTVQAAFDGIPDFYTGKYTVFVKNGTYYEKLLLDRNKTNVFLKGESRDSTILTYDDYANISGGTSMSYSVAIDADDFTAMDITFQNSVVNDQTQSNQQAVAIRVNGDRQTYYNCNFLGYQDTYYAWGGRGTGRTYMKNCYVEGSVDFIFGRNIAVFDSCQIHVLRNKCSITAANTNEESKYGLIFRNCVISHDSVDFDGNVITEIDLGRAWQNKPQTVFMYTYEPAVIVPQAWNPNPINSGITPALYAVYENYGPGYNATEHANGIGRLLTTEEAAQYTLQQIFSMSSHPDYDYDWMPADIVVTSIENDQPKEALPTEFALQQNYPNPFNPTTTITYSIPKNTHVKVTLYNVLGEKLRILVNRKFDAGTYSYTIDAHNLASGIYFYTMQAGPFVKTKKMILLK
jgi:pectin methylesterase-like acyl-CoA thioesterase